MINLPPLVGRILAYLRDKLPCDDLGNFLPQIFDFKISDFMASGFAKKPDGSSYSVAYIRLVVRAWIDARFCQILDILPNGVFKLKITPEKFNQANSLADDIDPQIVQQEPKQKSENLLLTKCESKATLLLLLLYLYYIKDKYNKTTTTTARESVVEETEPTVTLESSSTPSNSASNTSEKCPMEEWVRKLIEAGVEPNSTHRRLMRSKPVGVVSDAIQYCCQQMRRGNVRSPGSYLTQAIQKEWKIEAPIQVDSTPRREAAPNDPRWLWFQEQVKRGLVVAKEWAHLGETSGQKMIWIKQPDPRTKAPITVMGIDDAMALYPI